MKKYFSVLLLMLLFATTQCVEKQKKEVESNKSELEVDQSYRMEDFKKVKKIDSHAHVNVESKTMINLAKANNFKLLIVTVDPSGSSNSLSIKEKVRIRRLHKKEDPDIFAYSTAFAMEGWDDPDWTDKVIKQLKEDFDNGANSVKTWKNIGMQARDKKGNNIFLDDPKLDPVFKFIADQGKVLVSHAGEPHNCWLPLDSMTVKNDQNYFRKNPQFHMYLHPEMPSYQDQITHRDNMLAKNPDLSFIGAHMASLEWSVDEAAKFLDRFPNASMDMAERISPTQYQSHRDREKVRNFFIKYQDRILYATDFGEGENTVPGELEKYMMEVWLNDWKYFNTDEMVTVPQLDTPVQGLALPKEVVDKLYRLNAVRIFPEAWK